MGYRYFKDINRRTAADKVLRDKSFNFTKIPKYGGCNRGLASMVNKVFNKRHLVEPLHLQINL